MDPTQPRVPTDPTARPRIKICCTGSAEEARLAVRAGVDALGLVSAMPSGPGVIAEEQIAAIAATIPPGVASLLLTSAQDSAAIIAQQRRCRVNTLQLVDELPRGAYAELRAALPGIALVQVIHVTGPASFEEAYAVAPHVDALLLDSGNPRLAVKELGGTGRVHDWTTSRLIRETVRVPVYLAGGLHAGNLAEALRVVGPFGLDVCSRVRTNGRLDPAKLAAFIQQAWAAAP
jgi:phosphoribosylanthranilate isomerase